MGRFVFVVQANAADGRDDEFNEWYDNQHVEDMLAVDGFTTVRRFRLAQTDPAQDGSHRYLAIYEVEAEDADATRRAIAARAGAGQIRTSEALDTAGVSMLFFEETGSFRRGDAQSTNR